MEAACLAAATASAAVTAATPALAANAAEPAFATFVLSVERSVQEQLGILCHDTDVRGSGVDGVGTGAGTR